MNVTFREISKLKRHLIDWNTLVNSAFGIKCKNDKKDYKLSEKQLNIEIPIKNIFESGGLRLAMSAVDSLDFLDKCLFYADVSELVLPIYLDGFSDDKIFKQHIENIRKYKLGIITLDDWINSSNKASEKLEDCKGYFATDPALFLAHSDDIDYIQNALAVYYEHIYMHGDIHDSYVAAGWSILAIEYGIFTISAVAAYASIINSRSYKDVIENTMWIRIKELFIKHFC